MNDPAQVALLGCLFMLLIIITEYAARHWIFPSAGWMLMLGMGYGIAIRFEWISLMPVSLSPNLVIFMFLPVLIFASSRTLAIRDLIAQGSEIVYLSIAGPLIGMFLLALPIVYFGKWAWTHALLFGIALSPTDPLVVSSIFSRQRVPKRLTVLIEGESLFNDAIAVIFFSLLAGAAVAEADQGLQVTLNGLSYALFGALVAGAVTGSLAAYVLSLLNDTQDRFSKTLLPLVLTYGTFVLAHSILHVSGVIAVLSATVTLGIVHPYRPHTAQTRQNEADFSGKFWQTLETVFGAILFFSMGAMVGRHEWRLPWILVPSICAALLIARAITVYPMGIVSRLSGKRLPVSWQHAISAAGLRGTLSVILLLSLPDFYAHRNTMICLAFALLLFSFIAYQIITAIYLRQADLAENKSESTGETV